MSEANNKFKQTFDTWTQINKQLADDCLAYLKEVLNKLPKKEIEVNDIDCVPCYVTYDGGKHPEYNANPYSQVERVFIADNGDVYLDTEDVSYYSVSHISAAELYDVAIAVEDAVLTEYDIED